MATKQKKGRGWHGDSKGHALAGKLGGQATAEEYGPQFYHEIGRKGGSVSSGNFKNNPQRASQAGRKGGRSRNKAA
jgi:uncharacterized protein